MKKKIIMIFVVLLFTAGIAFGENNTTDTAEIEDNTDYILPISITNEGIKFDDGFIGFCIDSGKESISTSDRFTLGVLDNSEIENNIKLAIIECYKQGKEDAMADILSQINDKDSNNDVLKAVFDSNEKIGDTAVVEINNTTEGTFEFEFLKSSDDAKSDCVAYKVSMKTVEKDDKLTASEDNDSDKTEGGEQTSGSAATGNGKSTNDGNKKAANADANKKDSDKTKEEGKKAANEDTDNKTTNEDNKKTATNNNDTTNEDNKKTATNNNDTTTQETNKTIVNKTNTVIVNENNTTVINKNNVKTINNTTKETPQNDTVQDLLKAGNPILILVIVVAIIMVAVIVMRRKD